MKFTDLFISRPVLSMVVSLMIFIFGLRAMMDMTVRQFPKMESTTITITTTYPGADPELVAGFITSPIETAVASAEGIDYMTSSSTLGVSTITLYIKLNFDPQVAFTDAMSKVQSVLNQLPPESQQPVLVKSSTDSSPLMYISLNSADMTPQQITDYANRVIQPELETVAGVSQAQILGGQTYSMRIFLDPNKLAALQVTPAQIFGVLKNNNFQTAAGNTKGEYVAINVSASTDLSDVEQFKNIIIRSDNNSIIRIQDVAKVELGSQTYDSSVSFNGKKAVFVAITPTPAANPLSVISAVKALLPEIKNNFPPSLDATVVYDATDYIRASIEEVVSTIIEAAIIVIIVIFLFLGSMRSVFIPIVTIPLSLVGVCALMLFLGYSINLLTLLAMVLAIGLVVDDAIVVVENVYRHIEEGLPPYQAAITGAREIALPVISMTITLAAVYAPIGFMGGLTGALFKEFAFTLACSVIISGVIALTLSPMMCSKVLSEDIGSSKFVKFLDDLFHTLKERYKRALHSTLEYRAPMVLLAVTVLASLVYLYANTQAETAPKEDQGFFIVSSTAPQYASINYVEKFTQEFDKIFRSFSETEAFFIVNGYQTTNSIIAGMVLKPWDKRSTTQMQMAKPLQAKLDDVAGLQSYSMIPPPLPGTTGAPIQFVIKSTTDFKLLYQYAQKLTEAAQKSGMFAFVQNSLLFNQPQVTLKINRSKASDMGLNMNDVGSTIAGALSGGYVNYFNMKGRSYQVIPQLDRKYRLTPEQLNSIYIQSQKDGKMVPLATVADLTYQTQPNAVTHFQQLNSATLNAVMFPGYTIGDGLSFLKAEAKKILPKQFDIDYAGQSRQFVQEGNQLVYAFFFSIIVIFLVLSAQFESFRDPLIILISVPMSICGALIPLNLGLATINIYTQVGLITLIGLISKHGILIVDFANHLQLTQGLSKREAIEESSAIRLRPILMTTAAMIFGVVPLILASGAGAVSRFDIGLVISTGMLIGTCFTIFVVPTMYTFFAHDYKKEKKFQTQEAIEDETAKAKA